MSHSRVYELSCKPFRRTGIAAEVPPPLHGLMSSLTHSPAHSFIHSFRHPTALSLVSEAHPGAGESGAAGGAGCRDVWEPASSRQGLCETAWGGQEGLTKEATLKEEGEFARWTQWKGMAGRGTSTCRGAETWKHWIYSRTSTWPGMTGE